MIIENKILNVTLYNNNSRGRVVSILY